MHLTEKIFYFLFSLRKCKSRASEAQQKLFFIKNSFMASFYAINEFDDIFSSQLRQVEAKKLNLRQEARC